MGGGSTVGVRVDVPTSPLESETWYATGVAVPVKAPVHDAPAGVFAAEHGVNVTDPSALTAYVPCPATANDVAVQFGDT